MFYGYYSLVVYEIQAVYITLFLRNRDMLTFYCCFTHLLSEILNIILKSTIKQPRPENGAPSGGLFEGRYGMPSQHCHCFAYLITMVLLLTFHYYRKHVSRLFKALTLVICCIGLTLQVLGRIYLKFHTIEQCVAGAALGSLSATTFYLIGQIFFMPYAENLCNLNILKFFSFRKDLISKPPSIASFRSNSNAKLKTNRRSE